MSIAYRNNAYEEYISLQPTKQATPASGNYLLTKPWYNIPTNPRVTLGTGFSVPHTLEFTPQNIRYRRAGQPDVVLAGAGAPMQTFIASGTRLQQPRARINMTELLRKGVYINAQGKFAPHFTGFFYGGHFNRYENTTGKFREYWYRQVEVARYTPPPGTSRDEIVILVSCSTNGNQDTNLPEKMLMSSSIGEKKNTNQQNTLRIQGSEIFTLANKKAKHVADVAMRKRWRSGDQCYGALILVAWILYYSDGILYLQRRDTCKDYDGNRGRVYGPEGGYQGWQNWHTWTGAYYTCPEMNIYLTVLPNSTY